VGTQLVRIKPAVKKINKKIKKIKKMQAEAFLKQTVGQAGKGRKEMLNGCAPCPLPTAGKGPGGSAAFFFL
jgi:hypothetical protein